MDVLVPNGLAHMGFAVVDRQDYCISLHQHPDAAAAFLRTCARNDLRVVALPSTPGFSIGFEEAKPF